MKNILASAAVLLLVAELGQCQQRSFPIAKPNYAFEVYARDFYGAEGFGCDYYLDKTSLTVVAWDGFGNPKREVYSRQLTKDEQRDWREYLASRPWKGLQDVYSNPHIHDGVQQGFTFRTDSGEKTVRVENVRVEQLQELGTRLNALLPKELQIRDIVEPEIADDEKLEDLFPDEGEK